MQLGFFVREALRGLSRNSAPALAALLTVLLTALVLGVFIPIVQATTGTANEVRDRVVVDVFLEAEATAAERAELRRAIEETANVRSVEFISKAEGLAQAKKKNPDAFKNGAELLGENPLPDTFRVTPEDPGKVGLIVDRLAPREADGVRVPSLAGIDEVRNKEEDTNKILSATGLVKILTAGLSALLLFASIALIANTLRLSIFARRREVEVMKLVGATNWFIRVPFMCEGLIQGAIGAGLAFAGVYALRVILSDLVDRSKNLFSAFYVTAGDAVAIGLLIVAVGATVGAMGSAIGLRRFLDA